MSVTNGTVFVCLAVLALFTTKPVAAQGDGDGGGGSCLVCQDDEYEGEDGEEVWKHTDYLSGEGTHIECSLESCHFELSNGRCFVHSPCASFAALDDIYDAINRGNAAAFEAVLAAYPNNVRYDSERDIATVLNCVGVLIARVPLPERMVAVSGD